MLPEGARQGDTKRMGRTGATHHDELPGYATSEHGGDAEHDDAGKADATANPGHIRGTSGAWEDGDRIHGGSARWAEGRVLTREGWPTAGGHAPKTQL